MQRSLALDIGTARHEGSWGAGSLRLVFGGVGLAFEGPRELLARIARAAARGGSSGGGAPLGPLEAGVFCHVRCRLSAAGASDEARWGALRGARDLALEWERGDGIAVAPGAFAELRERSGTFEVEARIEPTQRGARNLLGLLAGALVWQAGGAVFHAAAVELAEGVVGFIGRSGAGKTTACQHVDGARLFSLDRLGVVPRKRGGWSAHPAPGGSPAERPMPLSSSQGRPLLALLRVVQGERGEARVEQLAGSHALAALRGATFQLGGMAGLESELLSRLERLSSAVVVGEMCFGLEARLGQPLEQFLGGRLGLGEEKPFGA